MIFKERLIHAAIFDMDGTMFDTERLRFTTIKQASAELFGESISDEILMGSLGLSAKKAEELAKSRYGNDYPYAAIRARADELELAHVRKHGVPVKPGLYEVLERLKRNGLLMAVATSSRRVIAEEYLINANVMKYFDITVCGDEVKQGKPHPEIFRTAAAELNCLPEHCLMFEDSENGLLSASRAGGLPILVRDIKEPRPEIKALAYQAYDSMPDFLGELVKFTPDLPKPKLTDAFPQTINNVRAGIHGFGAMGGGYLAQIFSHWDGYTRPYEIIGASNNATLRSLVNAFGKYDVHYGNVAFHQTIDRIRLIDMADEAAVCDMYVISEIIGLCLPESAIKQQAGMIAKGLMARFQNGARPLEVLVILNKVGGAAFVRRQVKEAMLRMLDAQQVEQIMAMACFTETVVNRMVSKISKEILLKQVRINFASFEKQTHNKLLAPMGNVAPLHQEAALLAEPGLNRIVGQLRHASQLNRALDQLSVTLFESGPDMVLYARKGGKILERLRQIQPVDNIAEIQAIKNRLLNGTHAIIAWYASLLGYQTIGQGMGDERVVMLVKRLINQEIKPAMLQENPALAEYINASFVNSFIARCKASFRDPCRRIGRDPLRKLQRKERIMGSIELAARHGITTPMLEFGAALGILYALRMVTPEDKECQRIKALFETSESVADVLAFDGDYHGKPYQGLNREADAALIERIAEHLRQLVNPVSAHWQWPLNYNDAEEMAS
ncbi:haloacid dehalogenase superfamily, subfamily IA, variant 3 with third motif having DD or ED [Methylobacillus rhizosphaerae]|uniref:Haloacid dehalogenase superfamily, subfamily IA, variant 3 with third motif having DD or ED n=1 Tax=Methylobacillus rhizosphaerae TaxID=551994 RepID=A0A238YH61_9PROT|nr:HAD family hydrolase [Methylobacillus rhizosphaerae]SNR69953.1 haloacid dehalogenase superfamily, subfamily IA, variant 3 with third motif having DD or ED [Methylobacillus rhizosphaerae]